MQAESFRPPHARKLSLTLSSAVSITLFEKRAATLPASQRFRVWWTLHRAVKEKAMAGIAFRILMIGNSSPSTHITLGRLSDCGWGSYTVDKMRDGEQLLKTFQVDIVLASETLPDGRGYDLADCVARQLGTLMVGVALSENALWLPVIDRGQRVLGSRAIGARMLEAELIKELTARALARGAPLNPSPTPAPRHAAPSRVGVPKRKNASAA